MRFTTTGLTLLLAFTPTIFGGCGSEAADTPTPPEDPPLLEVPGPPATWLTGIKRNECDNRLSPATTARAAMVSSGFSSQPFVDPNLQFVTAARGPTKVVITIDPVTSDGPTTAWLDIFSTSQTNSADAQMWRDRLRANIANTAVGCPVSQPIPTGQNPPGPGTPAVSTFFLFRSVAPPCADFSACTSLAAEGIRRSGFDGAPQIQNANLVAAFGADTSVAVECRQFGNQALMSIWASSMTGNTAATATNIRNSINALKCL
jgi:hypothetical protein